MRECYREVSYGHLDGGGTVQPWVDLPQPGSNYAGADYDNGKPCLTQ